MEWVDALAEWVLFPLLILYGFTSWAKDNQKKTKSDDPFPIDPSQNGDESLKESDQEKNQSH